MILRRQNRMRDIYVISEEGKQTHITRVDSNQSIIVDFPIDKIDSAWYLWHSGILVQLAFDFLTPDERRFIITGITGEEWAEMFKEK